MQCLQCIVLALLWLVAGVYGLAMDHEIVDPLQHIDFEDFNYGHTFSVDGTYNFFYQLPGLSSRSEKRTESGEVEGAYSFVAPEGDEFDFKYNAGKAGFRVESEALPIQPEDTDDVKRAKEEFFAAYEKALQMAGDYEYEEEEEEEEDEEESSEEESSEESSEEYGEESSEESGEDSSSEESSEEEEEEEGEEAAMLYKGFRFPNSFGDFGHPPPPRNFDGFAHRGRKPIPLSRH